LLGLRGCDTEPDPTGPETIMPPASSTANVPCALCGSAENQPLFAKAGYQLVRCVRCELVQVANPPSDEELARIYSFDTGYHQGVQSARLDKLHLGEARKHHGFVSAELEPGRLLDVGCSVGAYLRVAREQGWQVVGLEFSRDTSEIARSQHGLEVVTGSLADHPFPPGSFDLVTLWDVIEHLRDPVAALERAHELLRPGGVLAMSTPNIDGLFPRASYPLARWIRYWPHPEPPHHLFQFSKRTIEGLLDRAGFELSRLADRRIRLSYSFTGLRGHLRRPYRLPYTALFAPVAMAGPWVGMGDTMLVTARKRKQRT
jgi:2-polyprenyl-3-methyl-5-hydroxy-6-metoxy-1,4-benzoquinol methylase